ncbi:hypothetical protein [Clostridium ganghwense]|uniref:DUF3784 domain-containing protein n=1 Tax=Clostridium ganghwense TaxID=312089 RepID=A0ABT4CS97_9CLOT|nr:hypothetical protein [Clostridium ganghwense]MCY6371793.1 hypothetical protein [Clostridium ganghwense]
MSTAFKILLIVLGIVEIILALNMEKFTKKKYASIKVRNIKGLIQWEKITTILMGIAILFFACLSFWGVYAKYNTILTIAIALLMIITYVGRKRFI